MALDGAMMHMLANEFSSKLIGTKVDKIQQPSRDELVFVLRGKNGTFRLLISVRAACPRINLTENLIENPSAPPMLCMLLRKQLCGSRLSAVRQQELDRVMMLDFEGFSELGDRQTLTLTVEIMGRCSNAVLTDEGGRIIDALKRVDGAQSSQRLILPGLTYTPPPAQNKLNPLTTPCEVIAERILSCTDDKLDKAILNAVQGVSPIISRELAYRTGRSADMRVFELDDKARERLVFFIKMFADALITGGSPTMVCDMDGRPKDVSVLRVEQYGRQVVTKEYSDFSSLLEAFSNDRDFADRMKLKSHDLLRVLANASDRVARKLALQQAELEKAQQREKLRLCGDLISANIYRMEKGADYCELENYLSDNEPVRIKLDPRLTPSQNAQAYYKDYRKAQTAEKHLTELIKTGESELEYLDAVFDNLSRATNNAEVSEIRSELVSEGYIKGEKGISSGKKQGKRQPNQPSLPPLKFISVDGFEILVGRNNRQNDLLSLKTAEKNDIWLHVMKIPGAHTVIRARGGNVPNSTIEQAAILAATHSRARESGIVPVDYTFARYVTKQNGAKPGMVNYVNQHTVYVHPDKELAEKLAVKSYTISR